MQQVALALTATLALAACSGAHVSTNRAEPPIVCLNAKQQLRLRQEIRGVTIAGDRTYALGQVVLRGGCSGDAVVAAAIYLRDGELFETVTITRGGRLHSGVSQP